ncbi:hypothetical protein [Candidatus Phytoplasma tritici]|uniref:hypothetical protein n=1 Tax=Candidatus Phytoplasma tritici TaxID=321961 RepID=UPI0004033944|nr:hypothetical protein [Candidatus Phytoplasma tritici]
MDIQQLIINVFESKIFVSFISMIFGFLIYHFYLYIKELKNKYDFSDELREVVNKYLKTGQMKLNEYGVLIRIMAHMGNYLGIYRKHVETMIKEFGENGGLNFSEGIFDEKKKIKKIIII